MYFDDSANSPDYWICRTCGLEGPYSTASEHPRGWKFSLSKGLICSTCAKKLNITKNDEENKPKPIVKETWEFL